VQRGERPWSRPPPVMLADVAGVRVPRLTQFALQAAAAMGRGLPRPEFDGDDAEAAGDGLFNQNGEDGQNGDDGPGIGGEG
jgi:hypothetical protein